MLEILIGRTFQITFFLPIAAVSFFSSSINQSINQTIFPFRCFIYQAIKLKMTRICESNEKFTRKRFALEVMAEVVSEAENLVER